MSRPVPALLPAAAGAAAALLALSTLGLTWVRRSVEGPLGEAGEAQVEALTGREVAPVVAALVPATAALVVVALLLRGRSRAVALVLGALSALGAGAAALGPVLGTTAGAGRTTAVPLLAVSACLVAALSAGAGAVLTLRARRAGWDASGGSGVGAGAATPDVLDADRPTADRAPTPHSGPTDGAEPSWWHALDEGRDPTDARD